MARCGPEQLKSAHPSCLMLTEDQNSLWNAIQVMDLASAVSELPAGGQILMGPVTFNRVAPQLQEVGR